MLLSIKYFLISSYQETSRISFAQKGNILGFLIPNTINNFLLRLLNLNVNLFIFCIISMFLVIKFPIATIVTVVFALILIIIEIVIRMSYPSMFMVLPLITRIFSYIILAVLPIEIIVFNSFLVKKHNGMAIEYF